LQSEILGGWVLKVSEPTFRHYFINEAFNAFSVPYFKDICGNTKVQGCMSGTLGVTEGNTGSLEYPRF
jgi:hypothetical protein